MQQYLWLYEVIVQHIIPAAFLALAIMLAFVGMIAAFIRIVCYFTDK